MGKLEDLMRDRMEPDTTGVLSRDIPLASIAISLKRIADALEGGKMDERFFKAMFSALESSKAQR